MYKRPNLKYICKVTYAKVYNNYNNFDLTVIYVAKKNNSR